MPVAKATATTERPRPGLKKTAPNRRALAGAQKGDGALMDRLPGIRPTGWDFVKRYRWGWLYATAFWTLGGILFQLARRLMGCSP